MTTETKAGWTHLADRFGYAGVVRVYDTSYGRYIWTCPHFHYLTADAKACSQQEQRRIKAATG